MLVVNQSISGTIKAVIALLVAFLIMSFASGTSASELTQEKKEELHKQYVQIIEDVTADYPEAILEVVPLNEFEDKDWVEPAEFKELVIARAKMEFVESSEESTISPLAWVTKSKDKSFKAKGVDASVKITGTFSTVLNEVAGRQVFGLVDSITSKANTSGTWTQTGYTSKRLDGGREFYITVGGKYKLNGITSEHNLALSFYCSATGVVS